MRPIKFRGWATAEKKMYEDVYFDNLEVNIYEDYEFIVIGDIEPGHVPQHIILMQFTGLYDSTGKEIYEGDLVNVSIYTDEDPQVLEVKWENGCFIIDYKDAESDCCALGEFPSTVEIVGNIFEQPAEPLQAERMEETK